jgi:hypothetical protein
MNQLLGPIPIPCRRNAEAKEGEGGDPEDDAEGDEAEVDEGGREFGAVVGEHGLSPATREEEGGVDGEDGEGEGDEGVLDPNHVGGSVRVRGTSTDLREGFGSELRKSWRLPRKRGKV